MNIRFHRLAVAGIDHEVDYYESRQAGLGDELEDEIDAVLTLLRRFPEGAPQWKHRRDRRIALLDRFPVYPALSDPSATRSSSSRSHTRAGDPATGVDVEVAPLSGRAR